MTEILFLGLPHLHAQSLSPDSRYRQVSPEAIRYRQAFRLAPSFYRMQLCHLRAYMVEYMTEILFWGYLINMPRV